MDYREAMDYIANTSKFGMNFGLERVEKILELLGKPQKQIKCIHIGGTNGKGSTTAMISSVLKEQGYTVGMYTSPFLQEFEERIQINGVNISKQDLAQVTTEIKEVIKKVIELGYDNPTQFEIITAIMFYYFSIKRVDYAVIEVGLGGRLDATNVINPILTIITSISFDHMNILGNTLEEIAGEKAGIIKKDSTVLCYPQEKEVLKVIEKKCIETKSQLRVVSKNDIKGVIIDKKEFFQYLMINIEGKEIKIKLPLLGEHQINNCDVAINAFYALRDKGIEISEKAIFDGIAKVKWIGRMEVLSKEPLVVIDGAHNIDGIKKLNSSLKNYLDYKNLILIIGMLGDKEVDKMIDEITKYAEYVIVTEPHNERAESSDSLYNKIKSRGIKCFSIEDYKEAYDKGRELMKKDDLLLICGSLYMIGDMRKVITR